MQSSNDNAMPDEFYDWLDECPVQWFRDAIDNESISYTFMVPDEEAAE